MDAPSACGPRTRDRKRRYEESNCSALESIGAGPSNACDGGLQKKAKTELAPEWIGNVLQSNELIVSKIFDYLTANSLNQVAPVCRLWRQCAEQNRKERIMLHHFYTIQLDDVSLFDKKLFGRDMIKNLRKLHADPRLLMIFTTQDVTEKGEKYFDNFSGSDSELSTIRRRLRREGKYEYNSGLPNHISTFLPPGTLLQICNAWGVVATDMNEGPVEYEISDGLAAVCFSNFPNVKFHSFRVTEPKSFSQRLRPDRLIEAAGLGAVEDAKAMIAFSDGVPDMTSHATSFVDGFFTKHPKLALAGAAVFGYSIREPREMTKARKGPVGLGGIVIEGDVRAVSVVLDHECRGAKAVEEKLLTLKSFPIVHGRTVGFMFSCSGRGQFYHHGVNVEGGIFGSLFPGVPLLGLFGSGEFGVDSLAETPQRELRDFKHVYTTVLMLLTFNPPPDNKE